MKQANRAGHQTMTEAIALEKAKQGLDQTAKRALECMNACAGMTNPAESIEGLKAALKLAHDELRSRNLMHTGAFVHVEAALKSAGVL